MLYAFVIRVTKYKVISTMKTPEDVSSHIKAVINASYNTNILHSALIAEQKQRNVYISPHETRGSSDVQHFKTQR